MNRDWTDNLREQLAAHEEPVGRDLWADIEARLDETTPAAGVPGKPSRKARVVALRRWAAAAAVAAVLGGGALVWFQSLPKADVQLAQDVSADRRQRVERQDAMQSRPSEVQSHLSEVQSRGEELLASASTPVTKASRMLAMTSRPLVATPEQVAPSIQPAISSMQDETPISVVEPANAETEHVLAGGQPVAEPQQKKTIARSAGANTSARDLGAELNRDLALLTSDDDNSRLSLGLYALNGFAEGSSMQPVMMEPTLAKNFNAVSEYGNMALRGAPAIYLTDISETVNHKVPLSVGFSVGYGLTERLALQTGLTYTRAASEFTNNIRGAAIMTEQTLHYVGVPLQLRYDVWQWGSVSTYAAAGGQLDVNVKAVAKTEGVDRHMERDRAQWSLLGSVGLQYDIAPQLGLYGEVGARWYPDNGSQVENYFKDKPLGMNIQVGLRLNVGK